MKKQNDCDNCPYYGSRYDSFYCDGEEWCKCGIYDNSGYQIVKGCNYPLFIGKILAFKEDIKEKISDRRVRKIYEKEEKERIKLGMTEEEYFDYKNGEEMESY